LVCLGLTFLLPLLAEVLIPFYGAKIGDPDLIPQALQLASFL